MGEGSNEKAPVLSVVPGKPDHEIAEDYKREVMEKIAPVLEMLNAAKRSGFFITFAITDGGMNDLNGRRDVVGLQIIKLTVF